MKVQKFDKMNWARPGMLQRCINGRRMRQPMQFGKAARPVSMQTCRRVKSLKMLHQSLAVLCILRELFGPAGRFLEKQPVEQLVG
mmetsp:Transcript_22631/g.40898  ORF Transcript_22631/g.40898 Transcript_22631/m.40898 type:complete len:85 (+) Transcript_22631:3549-3803(+)